MGIKILETAQDIIRKTSRRLKIEDRVIERLIEPEAIHEVNFPVMMDDGKEKIFKGFRIQHNSLLGPYKGGIRFHPNVSREEVQALATLMSIKCAVARLPYGGGKGGVIVDPKKLSQQELERLSRSYTKAITTFIGPEYDIPAPDVNTNPKIMEWMTDEYIKQTQNSKLKTQNLNAKRQNYLRATFTGKPVETGGTLGRNEATGRGGVIVLKALLKKLRHIVIPTPTLRRGRNPAKRNSYNYIYAGARSFVTNIPQDDNDELTVAVQGYGNVGYYFTKAAVEEGFKVVAASDSKGAVYVKEGLDPGQTMKCKEEKGTIAGCYCVGSVCDLRFGKTVSNEGLLELPVDILVPAALENAIHQGNMDKIKAKIIVEMANGPITEEAYEYLTKKGVIIIPDVLANCGGVVVSYLEWYQNMHDESWPEEKVNAQLKETLEKAFESIWQKATNNHSTVLDLKQAAFELAIERIVGKMVKSS